MMIPKAVSIKPNIAGRTQGSISPGKYEKSPNRVLNEVEQKLVAAQRENAQLKQEYEQRQEQYDKVSYKNAKAQSQFIEVMRELSRFKNEFNDVYSLRSKLTKTQGITQKIDNLLITKNKALENESQLLKYFKEQSDHLFEQQQKTRSDESSINCKKKEHLALASKLKSLNKLNKGPPNAYKSQARCMNIGNVLCFLQYEVIKQKAECTFTIFPTIQQQVLTYTFKQITEKFDPEKELLKLQITSVDGNLYLTKIDNPQENWIDKDEGDLFYRVPNRIIKHVSGYPYGGVATLLLSLSPSREKLIIGIMNKDANDDNGGGAVTLSCQVAMTSLFKSVVSPTAGMDNYEEELEDAINRIDIIGYAITKYVKRNIQIGEIEASQSGGGATFTLPRVSMPHNRLQMYDVEQKGTKKKRIFYVGTRRQSIVQSNNYNQKNTLKSPQLRRNSISPNGANSTMRNSSVQQQNIEIMREAVQDYLNKKKQNDKSRGTFQSSTSMQEKATNNNKTNEGFNKMHQIMQLIHANSLFASIHQELYEVSREDPPVLLELVHSTDDDSLLLIMVTDPRLLLVEEIDISGGGSVFVNENGVEKVGVEPNVEALKQRYGRSTEGIMTNVETMFRSLEFGNLIKHKYQQLVDRIKSQMAGGNQNKLDIKQNNSESQLSTYN